MAYGAILGQTSSGKRVCRLVVGTSTSGWTASDCDYLCDGTADDVEINAAIQALPSTGGEIVILDGTYNITATIAMNKDNVKLSGNGAATILKRMWDSSTREGVISINATNGRCCVENFQIDGNKATYSSVNNEGIYLAGGRDNNTITGNTINNNHYAGIYVNTSDNNTITGNTFSNNNYGIYQVRSNSNTFVGNIFNNNTNAGIFVSGSNNTITGNTSVNNGDSGIQVYEYGAKSNTVTGNTCINNAGSGISLRGGHQKGSNNTITGNTCINNAGSGIYVNDNDNNTITGNTCIRGTGQSSDYTSTQYTIRLRGTDNNYNLIADNNIMGKNYVSEGGTGNTFVNNKFE